MNGFALETSAPVADGPVELETATPVIVKHESRHLLPGDEQEAHERIFGYEEGTGEPEAA
ncbi:hypothetical protein [Streptomyces sp. YIM 98790]|uniref:hypothetical protein n=1 Tax=Streptomyces sp. YIM 98790 TaxID=2689077 RepID=UPI00140D9F83|nr:hypothetical protein [Streptomyces sp. YIM 98790]